MRQAWCGGYHGFVRSHLASLVEDFRRHGKETAVVAHRGNRRYRTSYGELAELAGRFAAELQQQGVSAGDRVVLWGENSAEWIEVFFGCLLRGVIVVPLDAAGSSKFAERVVKDVSPLLIVGDRGLIGSVATDVPRLSLGEIQLRLPAAPLYGVGESVTDQTPFQIVFTSGTTSEPKGIVHTHRNVLASLQPIENEIQKYRKYERWVHPLRFLHCLPLSHVFGQFMGLWIPTLLGAEVHFPEQLVPSRMTELIQCESISVLIAVPRVLQLLRLNLLGKFPTIPDGLESARELPAWKRWWIFRRVHQALGLKFWAVISGGASLPAELEGFWNGLGFAVIQGYGMTETSALVTLNHPFHIGRGTIGRVLPGREIKISNEGEILVRGPMLAAATWQHGAMKQREGEWLATGDLADESESGELRFVGRKSDVIVTSAGLNVHPADLEAAMTRQVGVRGCVVVACETKFGPEPVGVVIFAGNEVDLQTAVCRANRELAEYQRIRRVLRWPQLQFPFTSTGKLLRREVARWACATVAERQLEPAPKNGVAAEDLLTGLIAEITGDPITRADSMLRLSEDLHLDSLGRVQLQVLLEQRLGVELEDDTAATMETLGELEAMVERQVAFETGPDTSESKPGVPTSRRTATETADSIYPKWPWTWPVVAIRILFIEIVMRPLVCLLAAPRVVSHMEELPVGPTLVISNHVTAYDGALILYALPGELRRRMAVAMSGEMIFDLRRGRNQRSALRNLLAPIAYWLVTALFNVFPLPRKRGFRRSFEHAGEAFDAGYSVLIFPEGTRSRKGTVQAFRSGIGLLAKDSQVPVLPIALIGLDDMRAKNSRWFHSGSLEIRVGEPVDIDAEKSPSEITEQLHERVRRLQL